MTNRIINWWHRILEVLSGLTPIVAVTIAVLSLVYTTRIHNCEIAREERVAFVAMSRRVDQFFQSVDEPYVRPVPSNPHLYELGSDVTSTDAIIQRINKHRHLLIQVYSEIQVSGLAAFSKSTLDGIAVFVERVGLSISSTATRRSTPYYMVMLAEIYDVLDDIQLIMALHSEALEAQVKRSCGARRHVSSYAPDTLFRALN